MIHAKYVDGKVVPITEEDATELKKRFLDGQVILSGDNCPELNDVIDRMSAKLQEQNREAYEALACYD